MTKIGSKGFENGIIKIVTLRYGGRSVKMEMRFVSDTLFDLPKFQLNIDGYYVAIVVPRRRLEDFGLKDALSDRSDIDGLCFVRQSLMYIATWHDLKNISMHEAFHLLLGHGDSKTAAEQEKEEDEVGALMPEEEVEIDRLVERFYYGITA